MRMSWRRTLAASLATATVALPSVLAGGSGVASAAVNGGNASGGPLEVVASKLPLTGPVGTGLTRGITPTSITVGCIYTAVNYPGLVDGIQARFARANKTGIFGRKINFLGCKDDAANVQTNVQQTQQLVNQSNVFALLGNTDNSLSGSTNFLIQNQVPFFNWGTVPGMCGSRWGFGWNGCLIQTLLPASNPLYHIVQGNLAEAIIAATPKKPSQIRVALQEENNPSGQFANGLYVPLWKSVGAKVVYAQPNFPSGGVGVDYTPYVQAVLAAKPNVVIVSTPFADIGGFVSALKAAGYKGITQDYVTYSPGLLQSSPQLTASLQGEYINSQTVPQEANTPFTKLEVSDLKAIGAKPLLTLGASIGWAEAEEFVGMVQAAGKNLNTKTFDQAVNGGKVVSYAGLPAGGLGKLKWPAAHFLASDCSVVVKIQGTGYKVAVPFRCYSSVNVSKA
jgi:branched-chain amino acid transport system substrate-binding protein